MTTPGRASDWSPAQIRVRDGVRAGLLPGRDLDDVLATDPLPIAEGSGHDVDVSDGANGDPLRTEAATRSAPPTWPELVCSDGCR